MTSGRLPWGAPVPEGLQAGYELGELLGSGAFGAAVRATQRSLHRPVVLKLLALDGVLDPQALVRFQAEARILARVEHPGVLPILDTGVEPGVAYLAYPDLGGVSLDRYLADRGRPTLAEVRGWLDGLLAGLAHIHGLGVVHRDLKPANLLRTPDGSLRLFDFGLARDLASASPLTGTGVLLGTPLYMSPELIRAEPAQPGDDLYALGVLAYEFLSGSNPFRARTVEEILDRQLALRPEPLHRAVPEVPEAVSLLVQELLAKDRRRRPGNAEEVRERLRRAWPEDPPRIAGEGPDGGAGRFGGKAGPAPVVAVLAMLCLVAGASRVVEEPAGPGASAPEGDRTLLAGSDRNRVWISRAEGELGDFVAIGQERPESVLADPFRWTGIESELPALAEGLRALGPGRTEVASPELRRVLEPLRARLLDAGIPDVLEAAAAADPSTAPTRLEAEDGVGPELREALPVVEGFLAKAVIRSRQARLALGHALGEATRHLREGTTPRMGIRAWESLRVHALARGLPDSPPEVSSSVPMRAYRDGAEVRSGLCRWLAPGHQALHAALDALARSLHCEPGTEDVAGVLGARWIDELAPLAFAPWAHLPPVLVLGSPRWSPGYALLAGFLVQRTRRTRDLAGDPEPPAWQEASRHLDDALSGPLQGLWARERWRVAFDLVLDVARAGRGEVDLARLAGQRGEVAEDLGAELRRSSGTRLLAAARAAGLPAIVATLEAESDPGLSPLR